MYRDTRLQMPKTSTSMMPGVQRSKSDPIPMDRKLAVSMGISPGEEIQSGNNSPASNYSPKLSPSIPAALRNEIKSMQESRRGSELSLTLSRRSSQIPSTLRADRSVLARRLSQLATKQARQNFSEQEQKTISKFSSLNYAPTHSLTFMRWLGGQSGFGLVQVQRWVLCIMVGLVTGFVAWILSQSTQVLLAFKWDRTRYLMQNSMLFEAFGWNCLLSVTFAAVASFLVVVVYPPAVGGGTPEVIAYLNGILVHEALQIKNLVIKFISVVFTVASNLPLGTQGPLISYGAIIGAGIGDFRSKTLGFSPNVFTRFRNAESRREFTTAGVAAGVAAGFNAPVGGLLFAMEDLSSFWGRRIAWQTFICATIATAVAQLLNTSFSGFIYNHRFGLLETSIVEPIEMHIMCIMVAVIMGLVGGLLGALFTHLNSLIKFYRKKLYSLISNSCLAKIAKITECMIIVTVMTVYTIYLPSGFSCSELDLKSNFSNSILDCIPGPNISQIPLEVYTCTQPDFNDTEPDVIVYNDVATLIQGGSNKVYLNHLWSTSTHQRYSWHACMTCFVVWFTMTMYTAGSSTAGGIFLPIVISGALYGRALGIGAWAIWQSITGEVYPTHSDWAWLDPGLFAIMGSASLLGGVTRLSLATTVIIIEMSMDLDLTIPIMITNFVAKLVADTLAKPLFVYDLDAKLLPFLSQEPRVAVSDHIVNLELYKARDVMTSPVWTIHSCETVSALAKLLIETDHEGFPVVKFDESTNTELAYGLITRTELYVILCSTEVYDETRPGTTVTPEISYDELSVDFIRDPETAIERVRSYTRFAVHNSIFVDLEPFINISAPKVDEDYSLHRTYQIFRTLGLRHLVVIDIHNQVVGIITRQDLLPFYIQKRIAERVYPLRQEEEKDEEETVLPAITVKLDVLNEKDSEDSDLHSSGHANPGFVPDIMTERALENIDSGSPNSIGVVSLGRTDL